MEWTNGIEGAFIQREKVIYGFVTPAFCLKNINIHIYKQREQKEH